MPLRAIITPVFRKTRAYIEDTNKLIQKAFTERSADWLSCFGNNIYNKNIITYEGVDSTTKNTTRLNTYGGKLVENIVQAIARDVLGEAMINLRNKGFDIVMHVHDEIVLEVENNVSSVEEVVEIMCEENKYLKGLKLKAEGFESNYYKK